MLTPSIFEDRAASLSRVPPQSGQAVKVTARSTNARMCGCSASGSLERTTSGPWDQALVGRLMLSTFTLVGSLWRKSWSSALVYLRIGLSGATKPDSA